MIKTLRECRECLIEKPIEEFGKTPYGHRHKCKSCVNVRTYQWIDANQERRNAVAKKYRQTHPEVGRRSARNARYKKTYGITAKEFDQKIQEQNSLCVICKRSLILGPGKDGACMDHCHDTGKLRDVLCGRCNVGLGAFEDDLDLMEQAMLYLKRWRDA